MMNSGQLVAANRPCAVSLTDHGFVLACALSGAHDEGYRVSRELAERFCSRLIELLSRSVPPDITSLAACARVVLSSDRRWADWHLAFSVGKCIDAKWHLFNSGTHCVLVWRTRGPEVALLPQSLARRLREGGTDAVPPFAEGIAATMFCAESPDEAIETVVMNRDEETAVAAFAEPRIADAILKRCVGMEWRSLDVVAAVKSAMTALHNANETFVFYSTP